MASGLLFAVGLLLVLVGFALAFLVAAAGSEGRSNAGGVIMIGPIPIVFGTDRRMVRLMLAFAVVMLALFFVFASFAWG